MGQLLKTYEGSNGKEHQILLGGDGVVYCDCPAWKFSGKKSCKHLDRFFADASRYPPHVHRTGTGKVERIPSTMTYSERIMEAINREGGVPSIVEPLKS